MKNKWLSRLVAAWSVATCLTTAGALHAQDLLEKKDNSISAQNPAASFGVEYQVMFEFLGKITSALQGSTDKDSTAANLTNLPQTVDVKGTDFSFQTKAAAREHGYRRLAAERDIGAQPLLGWLMSKDFNLDDPFAQMMDTKGLTRRVLTKDRDGGEVEQMTEAIAIPQFTFLVGLTGAVDAMMRAKDAELSSSRGTVAKDSKDFDPITYLLNPITAKDKE